MIDAVSLLFTIRNIKCGFEAGYQFVYIYGLAADSAFACKESFVTSPDFMMAEAVFRVRGPKPVYATFLLLPVKRFLLYKSGGKALACEECAIGLPKGSTLDAGRLPPASPGAIP